MVAWSRPTNVKGFRDFLGLTGYYRRFIKDYGVISHPFTELLKKDGFSWGSRAETTFVQLKRAMCETLVLGLLDFNKPFTLEIEAYNMGIGAVLM